MRRLGAIAVLVFALLGCSGGDQVTVPNLHHKRVTQAYVELRKSGLEVEIDGSFNMTPNHVSGVEGQAPEAGKELDVGSVVTIHPGFGLIGSVFGAPGDPIVVPPVVGKSLERAAHMLDEAGLLWFVPTVGHLERTGAPTLYSNYEVTRTSVEPGRPYDQVKRGTIKPLGVWVEEAE